MNELRATIEALKHQSGIQLSPEHYSSGSLRRPSSSNNSTLSREASTPGKPHCTFSTFFESNKDKHQTQNSGFAENHSISLQLGASGWYQQVSYETSLTLMAHLKNTLFLKCLWQKSNEAWRNNIFLGGGRRIATGESVKFPEKRPHKRHLDEPLKPQSH